MLGGEEGEGGEVGVGGRAVVARQLGEGGHTTAHSLRNTAHSCTLLSAQRLVLQGMERGRC